MKPPLDEESLVIEVFKAKGFDRSGNLKAGECKRGWSLPIGIFIIIIQLGVAAIPFGLYYDWGVFTITVAGTVLALSTGPLH